MPCPRARPNCQARGLGLPRGAETSTLQAGRFGLGQRNCDRTPSCLPGIEERSNRVIEERSNRVPGPFSYLDAASLGLGPGGVEAHTLHVELTLVAGGVAGPYRLRAAPAAQVVQQMLGQVPLAADPVHDLQVGCGAPVRSLVT